MGLLPFAHGLAWVPCVLMIFREWLWSPKPACGCSVRGIVGVLVRGVWTGQAMALALGEGAREDIQEGRQTGPASGLIFLHKV